MAKPVGVAICEIDLDLNKFQSSLNKTKDMLLSTTQKSEEAFRVLGIKSDKTFDMMRENATIALKKIEEAGKFSANEIARAQEAAAAKISAINKQQFGEQETLLGGLKANWLAASAAIAGSMVIIHQAMALIKEGAKATQTLVAFRNTAEALGFDPDKYVEELKRVTNATVDDSDLMQKAMKGISGGINPDDMLKLAEVSRLAARRMGIDVGEAYDSIVDAVEMMRTKTMVKFHLITKDQAALMDAAKAAGVEVDATRMIWLNYGEQMEIIGKPMQNVTEKLQQHAAAMKEMREGAGNFLTWIVGTMALVLQFASNTDKWADAFERLFQVGRHAKEDLAGVDKSNLAPGPHTEDIGPGMTAAESRKAYEDKIKAQTEAAKAAAAGMALRQAAAKAFAEEMRRVNLELDTMGQAQYFKDLARIDSEAQRHKEAGWSQVEIAQSVAKERELAAARAQEVETKEWRKAADEAVAAMEREIAEGIRLTEEHLRASEEYRRIMTGVYDEAATEYERSCAKIKREAEEKALRLQALAIIEKTDAAQLANDILRIYEARDRQLIEKETEEAAKRAKINSELISNIRGWETVAYNAKIAEIDSMAAKYLKDGQDATFVAAWVRDQQIDAYIKMGQAGDDWATGVKAALLDLERAHMTWGRAAYDITKKVFTELEGVAAAMLSTLLFSGADQDKLFASQRQNLDNQYQISIATIKAEALVRSDADRAKLSDADYVNQKIMELDKKMIVDKATLAATQKVQAKSLMDDFQDIWEKAWKSILQTVIDYVAKILVEWAALKVLEIAFGVTGSAGAGAGSSAASSIASQAFSAGVSYVWNYITGSTASTVAATSMANGIPVGYGIGTGAGAGALAASGPTIATTASTAGVMFTSAEVGATAGATTAGTTASLSPYLAAAGPYIVAAGAILAGYMAYSSMTRDKQGPALRQMVGGLGGFEAMQGEGPWSVTGHAPTDVTQGGSESAMQIFSWSSAKEKRQFIVEEIKNMRNYREDSKLTGEQLDALIAKSLGPLNEEFGASAKATLEAGDAMWELQQHTEIGQETTALYKAEMKDMNQKIMASVNPMEFLTNAITESGGATMTTVGAVQFLSDAMGLTAGQTAALAASFEVTGTTASEIEKQVELLASTMGINTDEAEKLAEALGLIPKDIKTKYTLEVEEPPGFTPPQTMARGGWMGYPTGGWLTGGSGTKDDIFMGMTGNVANYGMGGEFVVNKRSASKYGQLLELINRSYGMGGLISAGYAVGGYPGGYSPPTLPGDATQEQKDALALEIAAHAQKIALMNAEGRAADSLHQKRLDELAAMDDSLKPLQFLIYQREDEAKQAVLSIKLLGLQGKSAEVLAANRELELAAMSNGERYIQKQIYAQEDLNKKNEEAEKLAISRRGLENELLDAQGKTTEALAARREDELKALDPSLRALKQTIWATQDAKKAEDALSASRSAAAAKILKINYSTSLDYRRALAGATRGFDSGGYHPGGLRIVGESGPEIEWTGSSRIFSNKQSAGLLGSSELVAEVKQLRQDIGNQNFTIAANGLKMAKILDKWDMEGQPSSRDSDLTTWQ